MLTSGIGGSTGRIIPPSPISPAPSSPAPASTTPAGDQRAEAQPSVATPEEAAPPPAPSASNEAAVTSRAAPSAEAESSTARSAEAEPQPAGSAAAPTPATDAASSTVATEEASATAAAADDAAIAANTAEAPVLAATAQADSAPLSESEARRIAEQARFAYQQAQMVQTISTPSSSYVVDFLKGMAETRATADSATASRRSGVESPTQGTGKDMQTGTAPVSAAAQSEARLQSAQSVLTEAQTRDQGREQGLFARA